jgi:hypothetical protein
MFPNAFVPVVTITLCDEDGYASKDNDRFSFVANDTFGKNVTLSTMPEQVKAAVLEIASNVGFFLPEATLHVLEGETKHVVRIKTR